MLERPLYQYQVHLMMRITKLDELLADHYQMMMRMNRFEYEQWGPLMLK